MALNECVVMGRICHDLELKESDGKKWMTFMIACERDVKVDGVKWADFINCVVFGPQAEFIKDFFGKGKIIVVCGRLQHRDFGEKRIYEINVRDAYFGEAKKK